MKKGFYVVRRTGRSFNLILESRSFDDEFRAQNWAEYIRAMSNPKHEVFVIKK